MSSYPPELPPGFDRPFARLDGAAAPRIDPAPQRPAPPQLARQWSALHRAAAAVAGLAGTVPQPESAQSRAFPERVAQVDDWRAGVARQGVADLAAVMEPGLTALIAVHKRGGDPSPAAWALLQEFTAARDSLLALVCGFQDEA
ncbi:MAG: hypothetical protein KGN34_05010 [Sphingomonadales bacterium]|nr:hypothetical protein [Sphingomonadales bacterium]